MGYSKNWAFKVASTLPALQYRQGSLVYRGRIHLLDICEHEWRKMRRIFKICPLTVNDLDDIQTCQSVTSRHVAVLTSTHVILTSSEVKAKVSCFVLALERFIVRNENRYFVQFLKRNLKYLKVHLFGKSFL